MEYFVEMCYNLVRFSSIKIYFSIAFLIVGDDNLNFVNFCKATDLTKQTEIQRVSYVAFYLREYENTKIFNIKNVIQMLNDIGSPISNVTRIKKYIKDSKNFLSQGKECYTLTVKGVESIKKELSYLNENDVIDTNSELLDLTIFLGHAGYLDKLFKQADKCYTCNCYDACAVILRRIFEILLIESYKNFHIEEQIKNGNGNYKMLDGICQNAKCNETLDLSRNLKEDLDKIRNLGNFAAHKITYNTTKKDIDDLKIKIRTAFEELLYKSGKKR